MVELFIVACGLRLRFVFHNALHYVETESAQF